MSFMWIETVTDKQGKVSYKFVERYEHPYTGKMHKVSVTMDSQSPQAKKKATKLLQEKIEKKIAKTGYQEVGSITFGELVNQWWKTQSNLKQTTLQVKSIRLKKLRSYIEDEVLVSRIDKRYLIRFVELLQEEDLSYIYLSDIKSILNQILKYAVYLDYIDNNPLSDIHLEKKNNNDNVVEKYLTYDEAEKIWKRYQENKRLSRDFGIICELMFFTGLRIGEALTLQLKDYDGKNIHVNGTLNYIVGEGKSKGTPKTKDSYRVVSLPDRIITLLDWHIYEHKITKKEEFLFSNRSGLLHNIQTFNNSLKTVCHQVGIEKEVTSHWFRHSHITMLAEMNIPLKAIMDRVGHSDPDTTLKIYNHVTSKQKATIADKLNTL